jgi:2-C-methyl-D-erythritol 2,4-cyclodiphosphate synthase
VPVSVRVGLGYDLHALGADRPLVLGGVTVEGPGLLGHSDADVVAHAVADSLLGAAGLPDLGTMFPADDEGYRDADSLALLQVVAERVGAAGWSVTNVDVVVSAEAPRLAPHLAAMAANLGAVVGAPVGVKAKRGEGVGTVGRGEAIAAWAVALLEAPEVTEV